MSGYRPLEVTLISARDLKNVNFFSKLEVYAVATISGDPRTRQKTHGDREGNRNPTWNCTLRFSLPDSVDVSSLMLDIDLRSRRFFGDRLVGSVHIPISEFEPNPGSDPSQPIFVTYQVVRPSGKSKGLLNFSYRFGELISEPRTVEPVTAYPVYPPVYDEYPSDPAAAAYGYGTPQPGYGYGTPQNLSGYGVPQAGPSAYAPPYGAPQPGPSGYGYGMPPPGPAVSGYGCGAPPPATARPQGRKFGMGLGAGLLGGALGGMLLGDMMSDAAAYEAGFDDGGCDF